MKINRLIVAICVVVIIFGGIFLSQALGLWQTKNSGSGRGSSEAHEDEASHGDEEAESHDDIYSDEDEHKEGEVVGSSTVRDALDMGILEKDIIRLVGDYNNEDILIKDLATQNGLSFGKVKTALNELIK